MTLNHDLVCKAEVLTNMGAAAAIGYAHHAYFGDDDEPEKTAFRLTKARQELSKAILAIDEALASEISGLQQGAA